ncbi:hypothetical protein GIB67_018165 [Kingdonia uniflora]|uniref:Arf-GAP domain-containing protein n=1 Tax=Kingdonia uniflora TaxID=39325 RepID=A0A7J7NMB2_9MAGN|nr:hypothetical protein GIB67_018165 [Kingdonia uniflora]
MTLRRASGRLRTRMLQGFCILKCNSNAKRLKDLLLNSDNRVCADCDAPDPKWASANIGVFICLKCCGGHRSLGTHISKVLSVTLDDWSDDEIDSMVEVGGNSSANSIYEAYFPEGFSKPGPEASNEERMKFIRYTFCLPRLYTINGSDCSTGKYGHPPVV